jgi:hypothetical protein
MLTHFVCAGNVNRMGVIDQYQCRIIYGVKGWIDVLWGGKGGGKGTSRFIVVKYFF